MTIDNQKLMLTALEAEVVEAALELYVRLQPVPADRRFEYRYRAAYQVLANLRAGDREIGTFPGGDDEAASRSDDVPFERRPLRERLED